MSRVRARSRALTRSGPSPTSSRRAGTCEAILAKISTRSEEHTSELQSLAYLVCRLLLEKKNSPSPPARSRAGAGFPVRAARRRSAPEGSAVARRARPRRLSGCPCPALSPAPRPSLRGRGVAPRPLFFFNDTATTEIYTLSLHDALPI